MQMRPPCGTCPDLDLKVNGRKRRYTGMPGGQSYTVIKLLGEDIVTLASWTIHCH